MPTTRTRTALGLTAVALLGVAASACSSTRSFRAAGTTIGGPAGSAGSDTTAVASTTTAPAPTVAPTTMAPTTVAAVPATAPTLAPPAGGSVLAAPTNLQHTASGGVTLPASFTCGADPGIPGWVVADCQQAPTYGHGVTTLVMHRSDDGHFAVAVLFKSGSHLVQRYWAEESAPGTWTAVTVQLGDYHFDDGAEVWIGYHYAGTGHYLDLDVLDPRPDGSVFLGGLQGLDHGVVHLFPGGATVQHSVYGPSDPGCCASSVVQRPITFSGEQWWVGPGTTFASASAPALTADL